MEIENMKEKDIITVKTADGKNIDMELVLHYKDNVTNKNYIIYKPIDEVKLFLASYHLEDDTFMLDTDLTKEEIEKMEYLLNNTIKGE